MQDEVFHLNLVPKCIWSSEICLWIAKPDCSKPYHVESKQGVHYQIIMRQQRENRAKLTETISFYFAYYLIF